MLEIGIRLHDTRPGTLRERLTYAREQGFTTVHLAMSKAVDGFRMGDAPALLTEELAGEVRGALADTGMRCAVLGCYLNLATPDPEEYARTVEIYRAHLRFGKWIGAEVVGTETGAPNKAYATEPACFTEESLALFIERLRPVLETAAQVGEPLAIEPVCRHIVSTPARCRRVLEAYPGEELRVILDTVNLLTPDNAADYADIVAESIRLFGGRISVLHMKDFTLRPGEKQVHSQACGTGCMDYRPLLAFAVEKALPMTLEDTVPENAEAARLCLANTLKML
ncbi:MAG: sugar phosphate isomerase/epimerase [Clostridia bacterium]|nr:sugar phosphate isomerase/epimerase [Clostridia bacterium]